MRRRSALALLSSSLLLAACGGTASLATASPTAPTAAPATNAPAAPTPTAAGVGWTVTPASKAVVSVREQLVGVSLPSDAVLTATGATGTFKPNADGTFSADSKITLDLKMDTLQTRQFPKADFVPTKATGLTLPLATTGTFTFKLTGNLTIHGKTKEVTFDVVAKRSGADLTATATLSPSVKFGDFGMNAPSVPLRVVSIVDEIRLVVELVATGAAA